MKKDPPIVTLVRPEGKYSILYGIHVKTQNPHDLPSDATGVILETGVHPYLDDPQKSLEHMRTHVQYRELFSLIEKKKIPVYFVDVKYRFPDPLLLMADTAFSGMEYMAGMNLMKKRKKPVNFLVGTWLLLPFLSNVLRLGSAFTGIGMRQTGELKKFSHRLHPEADFLYLTLRNTVIAEKLKFLMEYTGKNSHLVTVLGAGHVGIEDSLQMSDEKREALLKRFMPIIKKIVREQYFYSYMEFRYDGRKWTSKGETEVPRLSHMLT